MKTKDKTLSILITVIGIILSIGGRWITLQNPSIPLYLHYVGILFAACLAGWLPGVITSVITVLFGVCFEAFVLHTSVISEISFLIPMVAASFVLGKINRKENVFESVHRTIGVFCFLAIIRSVVMIATNGFFHGGYTGLEMCDISIAYLDSMNAGSVLKYVLPSMLAACVDTFVTILILFCLINLIKLVKGLKIKNKLTVFFPFHIIVFMIVFLCSPMELKAISGDNFVQRIYSSEEGLLGGAANGIAQRKNGSIWVATYGGLYKFNGTEFVMVRDIPTARSCSSLYVDDDDNMWIATNGTGLVMITPDNRNFILTEQDGLPSDAIRSVLRVSNGVYYVGTVNEMAIVQYDGNSLSVTGTIEDVLYAKDQRITPDGYVLATTNAGEVNLIKDGKIMDIFDTDEDIGYPYVVSDSEIYLPGSGRTLFTVSVENGRFIEKKQRKIVGVDSLKSVLVSSDNILYLSGGNGVGYIDNKDVFHLLYTGDYNRSIERIMEDYQKNIWFTSYRCGLLELSPSSYSNLFDVCNIEKKGTDTVKIWNDLVYVGADDGLYILDERNSCSVENAYNKMFKGYLVRSLTIDNQNHLWVSTDKLGIYEIVSENEIYKYNEENGLLGNRARCTIPLSDGRILASTYKGICFIENHKIKETLRIKNEMLPAYALCLLEADEHTIFAGTNGDGICVIKDGKVEQYISSEAGLPSGVILNLYKDQNGEGYFVLSGSGLCYMDKDYTVKEFSEFPFYNNTDLFQTKNKDIVVLSTAGIYIVNYDALMTFGPINVHHLDEKMGLPGGIASNARNYITEDEILYFAGNTGVYKIDCVNYEIQVDSYKVNMKSVTMDKEKSGAPVDDIITVPAGIKEVALELELYNFTTTDPYVKYSLSEVDYEPATVLASQLQKIVYYNIPSGKHTFQVEVLGPDQSTVIEKYTYTIEKCKEAYETKSFLMFFRFGIALILLMLIGIAVNIPLSVMKRRTENELSKKEIERKTSEKMLDDMIKTLALSIDAKDAYTHGHSERVAQYSLMLARNMNMTNVECKEIFYAGLVHDIGKMAIPDSIINKTGKLTDEEFGVIKSHPERGDKILVQIENMNYLAIGAKFHHEKYDGTGYPTHAKGENIPLYARIIAVADSYDAMTSKRSYRDTLPQNYVKQEIWKGIGTQFDPVVAKCMISFIDADINYDMREKTDETYEIINEIKKNEFWDGHQYQNTETEDKVLADQSLRFFAELITREEHWQNPEKLAEISEAETSVTFTSTTSKDAEYIWNVPTVILYSSKDGLPVGEEYEELAVYRCAGYSWRTTIPLSEESQLTRKEAFGNWNNWMGKNKEGLVYRVSAKRNGNLIYLQIANDLIEITGKVELPKNYSKPVYMCVAGEYCMITDICL